MFSFLGPGEKSGLKTSWRIHHFCPELESIPYWVIITVLKVVLINHRICLGKTFGKVLQELINDLIYVSFNTFKSTGRIIYFKT